MTTRSAVAAQIRQALRTIELTPDFIRIVTEGAVSRAQLLQFLDDALSVAIDQAYLDLAEKAGGVPSVQQISVAGRRRLFEDMTDASLEAVREVAGRAKESWADSKVTAEVRRAILSNAKDRAAVDTYAEELKSGDPKARRRKLRDRRYDRSVRRDRTTSAAKQKLMVTRYRERLASARSAALARDLSFGIEAETVFTHWSDRADAGDEEALGARKFWGNRGDGKVRDSHVYVEQDYPDGVPLNETFATKYGRMRYPHDRQGDIRDWAGCRCKLRVEGARRAT